MNNSKKEPEQPCVLLVDDDKDWLMLMQSSLKKEGLKSEASVNGDDLWEKIESCHPHVILMDIHMAGVSGESFCRSLKANSATSNIPILMFSSNENIHVIAKRCGANGYAQKSASTKEIKELVMQYV